MQDLPNRNVSFGYLVNNFFVFCSLLKPQKANKILKQDLGRVQPPFTLKLVWILDSEQIKVDSYLCGCCPKITEFVLARSF